MPEIRLDTADVRHLSTFREPVERLGRERPNYVLFPFPSQKKLSGSRELISSPDLLQKVLPWQETHSRDHD